jgi:hypothetical protein
VGASCPLDTVASNLQLVIPSQAAVVTEQVESFLAHREVVGIPGLLALGFFSSPAFTVIESALHAVRAVRVFGYTWPSGGVTATVLRRR